MLNRGSKRSEKCLTIHLYFFLSASTSGKNSLNKTLSILILSIDARKVVFLLLDLYSNVYLLLQQKLNEFATWDIIIDVPRLEY